MEIKFVFDQYKNYPHMTLVWYALLEKDEEQFEEEIKQEVDLNLINQFKTIKIW